MKKILTKAIAFIATIAFILCLLPLSGGEVLAAGPYTVSYNSYTGFDYSSLPAIVQEGEEIVLSSYDGNYQHHTYIKLGETQKADCGPNDNNIRYTLDGGSGDYTWTVVEGTNSHTIVFTPKAKPQATNITINPTSLQINVEESGTITATVTGEQGASLDVTWNWPTDKLDGKESGNTLQITGKSTTGTEPATITATTVAEPYLTATCSVTVNPKSELKVEPSMKTIKMGDNPFSLTAKVGEEAVSATWTSEHPEFATVNENGEVTAKGVGTTVITATYQGHSDTCTITVVPNVDSVVVTPEREEVRVGKTLQLTANVTAEPSGEDSEEVIWSVDDQYKEKVEVDAASGLVTAKAQGTAIIKATSKWDETKFSTCTVEVLPPVEIAYKQTTELKAGKNYLIASGNSGSVVLLGNSNGSVAEVSETVETGNIIFTAEQGCEWEVVDDGNGDLYLKNDEKYLSANGSGQKVIVQPTEYKWKWDSTNKRLSDTIRSDHYLVYANNLGFINNYTYNPVSFFEELPACEGHKIEIDDEIGVQFVMDLSSLDSTELDSSYMEFTIGKQATKPIVYTKDLTPVAGSYRFTCPVNSLQMADLITATFYVNNKPVIDYTYSVKDYIDYIVAHDSAYGATLVNYVKAMGDYGHYAQVYLSRINSLTISNDPNSDYKPIDKYTDELNLTTAEAGARQFIAKISRGETDVSFQMRLTLDAETKLLLRANSSSAISELKGKFEGHEVSISKNIVTVPNIKFSELGDYVDISGTIDGKRFTGKFSVLSYAYSVLCTEANQKDQKEAMAALYYMYDAVQSKEVSQ